MKDAANLILVDKTTNLPVLFIDYANATSSEWSSEAVYATKKGTNAIRWDNARTGTLTVDTELFDFGLLAMVMGGSVKEGTSDIFTRIDATLDESRKVELGTKSAIDAETISVIKLKSDLVEHDGSPIQNLQGSVEGLPAMVQNISIAINDTSAKITFPKVAKAESYIVKRGGEVIAEPVSNSFIDTGLTPETKYEYIVIAVNTAGKSPASAVVAPTTAATGVNEFSNVVATEQAKLDAAKNVGEVNVPQAGSVAYTYLNGVVTFNENALPGESFAIYYMEAVANVRTVTIDAEKFPGNYEIFANATIREQETGADELVQIHYKNAKPQSNFTLTQSATEPTNLSIVFDLFPDAKKELAEIKVVL